jgi:hypothetical protein
VKPVLLVVLVAAALLLTVRPPLSEEGLESERLEAGEGGLLGSRFADAYEAFAPLFAFHESYAEHVFDGAEVIAPARLSASCEAFAMSLAELHVASALGGVGAPHVGKEALALLRTDADAFCRLFRPLLEAFDASDEVDPKALAAASDAGLFARIYEINGQLNDLLEDAFASIVDDGVKWRFSVAFAVRAILRRDRVDRIDPDLATVLYGAEGSTSIPFPVPEPVAEAMAGLVGLVDRDLDAEESARALRWSATIHEHFVPDGV